MLIILIKNQFKASWKCTSNSSTIIPQITQKSSDKKEQTASKMILTVNKGQSPISLKIDGFIYSNVIAITFTLKDSESAIQIQTIK